MKKIILFSASLMMLVACSTSEKQLRRGNYDLAINKSTKKLSRKVNSKEARVLKTAYDKAAARDLDRIAYLKKEGRPENWENIYLAYKRLEDRQNKVKPLLPLRTTDGQLFDIEIRDYSQDIINAKRKTAEYYYVHASRLLESKDRYDARKAYGELQKVKYYYRDFKNTDALIEKALFLGTNNVLFEISNKSPTPLPAQFENELKRISMEDLSGNWINYDVNKNPDLYYDFSIKVNIRHIEVSPERITERQYSEEKKIDDGFEYVLDEKGNVRKDTAGNDIKVPKHKTIRCNIVESIQTKASRVVGTLDYIDNRTGDIIKTEPLASETFFENRSAIAIGDSRALKEETRAVVGGHPVPFPPDGDMILQAGANLKEMVKDIIWKNRSLLR